MWSSQWISNLSNWNKEAWKKSGLQRDSNPWPPRYRCDALPTELWSHTLGARSIVSSYFPVKGVKWCNVYEMMSHWWCNVYEMMMGKYELTIDLAPNVWLKFIAQLVEHRTGIAEVTGSNPRLLYSNCLNWKFTAKITYHLHIYPQFTFESFHIHYIINK